MADRSGGILVTSSKTEEGKLRMGSLITSSIEGPSSPVYGRVGPFVRVKETGQLCFLMAKCILSLNTVGTADIGVKIYDSSDHILSYVCGTVIGVESNNGDTTDTALVSTNPKYVSKDIGQIYRSRFDFHGVSALPFQEINKGETSRMMKLVMFAEEVRMSEGRISPCAPYSFDKQRGLIFPKTKNFENTESYYEMELLSPTDDFVKLGDTGAAVFTIDEQSVLHCIGLLIGILDKNPKIFILVNINTCLRNFKEQHGYTIQMIEWNFGREESITQTDIATQQLNPKTSSDDTKQSIVSDYDSDDRTGVNSPELKDGDRLEELKQHKRALYTNLHEIEDSRNIPLPANDQDVETWYIDCTSRWRDAPEHIFYDGIFDTVIEKTRELPELKHLTLTDMIIGRHKFSMSITEKDIACLKVLDSDSKFRKTGSMIMAKYAENVCFDKDDFRTEEGKSRSFASYIVLDMICRMCVKENDDIIEAYPALEENKGEPMIICVSKKRSCLSEYKRFSIREISINGTSTESQEAENVHDKDDENVKDLYDTEVNETLSHHVLRLMEKHSNLEAAKVSFVRSKKSGYDYSEPCIVLYCLGKTLVPYGEDLFPVLLQHPTKQKTFKTDVREGYYSTCHGKSTSRHQELAMGCNIGEKGKQEFATLGPLVEFVRKGEMGFLTVGHLFEPVTKSDLLPDTKVVQPSDRDVKSPSSSSDNRECGFVVTGHIGGQVDAALVRITDDRIPQRGNFIEIDPEDLEYAGLTQQPTFDDGAIIEARLLTTKNKATRRIIKVGSVTGLTKGTLSTTKGAVRERKITQNFSPNGRRDSTIIQSQVIVDSYCKKFCDHGDSGSAVFLVEDENDALKCIGIIIGMIKNESTVVASVVTPIEIILPVLEQKCGEQLRLKDFFEKMQE